MQHAFKMRLQEFQNEQLLIGKYAVAVEREAERRAGAKFPCCA
jgi:hypothetical protein